MRFSEEENQEQTEPQEQVDPQANEADLINALMSESARPELRMTGIYGDVNEERCSEAIYGLMALHLSGTGKALEDPEDPESDLVDTYQPIEFIVSSHGGLAADMFSVYDTIRSIRDMSPIHTKGLGKVMSAGVLLLASGTKGERRIGKYCRVMIHGVQAGQHENEFKETRAIQRMYIKALAEETSMSEAYVKKLMNRKTNVYLDAEEAVKLGIADIIF
jgi:ATP-dependent protease ClpP protease subunit